MLGDSTTATLPAAERMRADCSGERPVLPTTIAFPEKAAASAFRTELSALLKSMAKIYVVHIPYRGSGPALQDLLAGQGGADDHDVCVLLRHRREP